MSQIPKARENRDQNIVIDCNKDKDIIHESVVIYTFTIIN